MNQFRFSLLNAYETKYKKRICSLCTSKTISTQIHAVMYCQYMQLCHLRNTLHTKMIQINYQWDCLFKIEQFQYLAMACDKKCNYYFQFIYIKNTKNDQGIHLICNFFSIILFINVFIYWYCWPNVIAFVWMKIQKYYIIIVSIYVLYINYQATVTVYKVINKQFFIGCCSLS